VIEEFNADASQKVADQLSISAKTIVLEASDNITLKVGGTSIAIEKDSILIDVDGKLEIKAKDEVSQKTKKWTVKGETDAKIDTASLDLKGTGKAEMKGGKITVQADGPTTIKGATVMIN
jgi:type VI secretion system secreted protein VgrG